MDFNSYKKYLSTLPYTEPSEYMMAICGLNPSQIPLGVFSIANDETTTIVVVPAKTLNRFGVEVPIIAVAKNAFAGKDNVTDIVLPSTIYKIAAGTFSGCSSLKRITIPKELKIIKERTFSGCDNLEEIFYEGTPEEWEQLNIVHQKHEIEFGGMLPGTPLCKVSAERYTHIPGNDALFTANIHFNCNISKLASNSSLAVGRPGKDISGALPEIMSKYSDR